MSTFESAITPLLAHEGSTLVPEDNGRGPSKYGVTLKSAREFYPHWTAADIARLDPAGAAEFYRVAFWRRYGVGLIESQGVADKVLDLAVNIGGGTAVRLLQSAVGVKQDGLIGPKTARAVNATDPWRTLATLRVLAERHYRDLVARNPKLAPCLPGWLARLAS